MKRLFVAVCGLVVANAAAAQTGPRGWEMSGLPALNFNADEGFGYGIIAQAFQYGDGTIKPYEYTIQPLLFLTTKGRRDLSVFIDAPHLLPHNWRMGVYLGREQQLSTPFYGVGNSSPYQASLEAAPNPYYYRYGRTGVRFNADFQHAVAGPLRLLIGTGARTSVVDQTPFDSGTTLLVTATGSAAIPTGRAVTARVGLIYDTRDRETGPSSGQWIEALLQKGTKLAGGTHEFTRATGTARLYVPVTDRLVWAQRGVVQQLAGNVPFYELYTIQGSGIVQGR
jgi:outer membrane protein assembly factor BamA